MKFNEINGADYQSDLRTPLPVGNYKMQITEGTVKPTISGTGQYLDLVFEVIEGPFQRRKVFQKINIRNANDDAQRIGRSQLAGIMNAIGLAVCNDTDQLLFKPMLCKVGIEHDKTGQYEDKSRINSCMALPSGPIVPGGAPMSGAMPGAAPSVTPVTPAAPFATPAMPQASQTVADAPTPPWMR